MYNNIKIFLLIIMISLFKNNNVLGDYDKLAYDFNFKQIDGSQLDLNMFKDKVIVVINVASQCGFTNQYEDMQKIWKKYQSEGLLILGVPSNDFGSQEPGSNKEIKTFCETKFGITFPITEKTSVKGENAHPFYKWAKKNYGNSAIPKWNFHKIIIDKSGKIYKTYTSITNPSSKKFVSTLEELLKT